MKTKYTIEKSADKSVGSWDSCYNITINDGPLTGFKFYLQGMVSGCGAAIMSGATTLVDRLQPLNNEKKQEAINSFRWVTNNILYKNAADGQNVGFISLCGTVLATLGESYYHKEATLIALGFKKLDEYNNWQHGTKYMQTLYGLHIEKS